MTDTKIDDGGPAFPKAGHPPATATGPSGTISTTGDVGHDGMSLRDWFAGQAIQGFLANTNVVKLPPPDRGGGPYIVRLHEVVRLACDAADALLAALAEPKP
mgnify:FL=1